MFNLGILVGAGIGFVVGAIAAAGYFAYCNPNLKWTK